MKVFELIGETKSANSGEILNGQSVSDDNKSLTDDSSNHSVIRDGVIVNPDNSKGSRVGAIVRIEHQTSNTKHQLQGETSISRHSKAGRTKGAVNLRPAERTAVLAMLDAGQTITAIGKALRRDRSTIRRFVQLASRDVLRADLPAYAALHKRAAQVAAANGDARPAQWALERMDVVKPVRQADTPSGGFTVKIGVLLPGLPSNG